MFQSNPIQKYYSRIFYNPQIHPPFKDVNFYLIGLMILIISVLHYSTDTSENVIHGIYRRLYYIPIIIASFRYGLFGGVISALIISLVYMPHVVYRFYIKSPGTIDRIMEIVLFNAVGIISGILVRQEKKQSQNYQRAARQLKESLEKLKRQSDQIQEIEDQLRFADRLSVLGEMAASLAHEIRNPLGSIKGVGEILAKDYNRKNEKYEFIKVLIQEVNRLNEVVENFLSLARPNINIFNKCSVDEAIKSVVTLIGNKAKKQHINITCNLKGSDTWIPCDISHFSQVLLNIILNSIDAMPDGGDLHILTETKDRGRAVIKVLDTGTGIAEKDIKNIFKPFYTTKENGTGLGLPIAKRIIESCGGSVSVSSTPGKGTVFLIEIPLTAPHVESGN